MVYRVFITLDNLLAYRDPNLIEGLHHVYFYDLDSVKPRRDLEWIMDDGRTLTWEQQLVRLQSTSDADPWVVRS